jgi:A/G-specific adenine glycosylase
MHREQTRGPGVIRFAAVRKKLARWYEANRRDLPWRRTTDPYAIWVSEIMLQQTRVAAAVPYYQRFLDRFPDVESLASAREADVLACWSGLGYYSRARNLQAAAKQIVEAGAFPRDYDSLRALPGVGGYTAAAIASIAFGLPYAVVDGNVKRVVARLSGSARADAQGIAGQLLDPDDPSRSNQAIMELGAMVCTPRNPGCTRCPLAAQCAGYRENRIAGLPAPRVKPEKRRVRRDLLIFRRKGRILLVRGLYVKGLWDFPDHFSGVQVVRKVGEFRHSIMNSQYQCRVFLASGRAPRGGQWWDEEKLGEIPLSTTAKKALRCLNG